MEEVYRFKLPESLFKRYRIYGPMKQLGFPSEMPRIRAGEVIVLRRIADILKIYRGKSPCGILPLEDIDGISYVEEIIPDYPGENTTVVLELSERREIYLLFIDGVDETVSRVLIPIVRDIGIVLGVPPYKKIVDFVGNEIVEPL